MTKQFTDYEQIKALLLDYFAAVYEGNIEKLKTLFHKDAAMYGYLGDNPVIGTPEIFFADLSSKPSMAAEKIDCRCIIKAINVCGNIAGAAIIVDNFFGSACVEDRFHLMKIDGQWQIVCKTFTTL